jgi:hypothetical protein
MTKKKLRAIVIDGATFYWSFTPTYECLDPTTREYQCRDRFVTYAESNRSSPLSIVFITWENAISGGPLRTGAPIIVDELDPGGINLHTPKWAAILIREGLKRGWQANAISTPYTIENGVEMLLTICRTLRTN